MSKAAAGHLRAYDADALRTQSRADFVYDSLRDAIWEGRFAHGERLREEEIASALGVSRTPVRETLFRLEREGLVRVVEGKGAFVAAYSLEDMIEIYQMREGLEPLAARLNRRRGPVGVAVGRLRYHVVEAGRRFRIGQNDAAAFADGF